MILLHALLAVAFILLFLANRRIDKLHKAFQTQGDINKITKQAFDLLAEDIANDRVLKDKTISALKGSITRLKNKK